MSINANFLAISDAEQVAKAINEWVKFAEANRIYSMAEIVMETFSVEFETDEFWRVACTAGDALRENGFKQVNYKNRRFWVKR